MPPTPAKPARPVHDGVVRLELLTQNGTGSLGAFGNIFINVWRTTPNTEMIRLRRPWFEHAARTYTTCGLLTVLDSDASHRLPDAEYRAESRHQMSLVQHLQSSAATVFHTKSMMTSLIRTFLRGHYRMTGGRVRAENFEEVDAAAQWLSGVAGPEAATGPTLAAAVRDLAQRPF